MPIYEYVCEKCEEVFEELILGSKAENDVQCPKCGEKEVKRKTSCFASTQSSAGATFQPPAGGCASGGG